MAFRFVHTADLHLDSPLRSLAMRNSGLAELIGDATRQALVAIVDFCIDEQVNALFIAGDLYDGDQTSMKTARFLASQMQRLHEAGIATFIIRGNHDALSRITPELILPPSVTIYGGRSHAVDISHGNLALSIHGLSFAKPQAPESFLEKFHHPTPDAVNIGIMHTSLAGAAGHDLYAPCKASELHAWGFDYWALGHIHVRTEHAGDRTVIMPGMPQGRDINEAGEKSVTLVTVNDDRSLAANGYIAEILCGMPNPLPLAMWHGSNLAEPETAHAYVEHCGDLWHSTPDAIPFLRWLHTHPKVLAERARIHDIKEQFLWERDVPKRQKLVDQEEQLLAEISDKLSKEIVIKQIDRYNRPVEPWL
jgi:DNA repair exonuclease SbcCD nuclease subunit